MRYLCFLALPIVALILDAAPASAQWGSSASSRSRATFRQRTVIQSHAASEVRVAPVQIQPPVHVQKEIIFIQEAKHVCPQPVVFVKEAKQFQAREKQFQVREKVVQRSRAKSSSSYGGARRGLLRGLYR